MSHEYEQGRTILGNLKSTNKHGNPWHDPRNGEFTSGPKSASASPLPAKTSQKNVLPEKSHVMEFIEAHHKDAAIIAASLNIPTEMILGLSGIESNWGQSRFALEGNNYFSQHAGKNVPFQKGSMPSRSDGMMATYESYLQSGHSFVAKYGDAVRGIKDPTAFAQALVHSRFNSGMKNKGGNNNFVSSTADTIKTTKKRLKLLK